MNRRFFLAAIAVLASACGGGKQYWQARSVVTPVVRIEPKQVVASGKLLYVETVLWNGGPVPVTVNRDAVVLILPNGAEIGRSQGSFTQHAAYVVPPGGSRAVHVDFRADNFRWRDVSYARVDFSRAVSVDGVAIPLPAMDISPNALPPAAPAPAPAPAPAAAPASSPGGIEIKGNVDIKAR